MRDEIEIVGGLHAGQSQGGVGPMSGDARALSECEVRIMMIPDDTAVQVHSFG